MPQRLRSRIAEVEGERGPGRASSLSNVFVANGSNEVLQTLCLAYGGAGRTVLTHEPTYALHSHIARVCGTDVVEGAAPRRLHPGPRRGRRPRSTSVRPAITFLCSPNNPTGRLEDEATVTTVLDAVESVDGLLVVDEAYGQFSPWSALSLVDEDRSIVVTRTYSKTWSAAALRLGLPDRADLGGRRARQGRAAVPPGRAQAARRAARARPPGRDAGAGRASGRATGTGRRARSTSSPVDQWPSAANFILFRPRQPLRRARSGPSSWSARCWCATARRGPG